MKTKEEQDLLKIQQEAKRLGKEYATKESYRVISEQNQSKAQKILGYSANTIPRLEIVKSFFVILFAIIIGIIFSAIILSNLTDLVLLAWQLKFSSLFNNSI